MSRHGKAPSRVAVRKRLVACFDRQVFGQGPQEGHGLIPRAAAEFEVLALMQFDSNAIAGAAVFVIVLGDLDACNQAQGADNLPLGQGQAKFEEDGAVFVPLDAPETEARTPIIGANAQRFSGFVRHRLYQPDVSCQNCSRIRMGLRYNGLVRLLRRQEITEGLHQAHSVFSRAAAEADVVAAAAAQSQSIKRLAAEILALANLCARQISEGDGAAAERDDGRKPNNLRRLVDTVEGRQGADSPKADAPYSQSIVCAFNNRHRTLRRRFR